MRQGKTDWQKSFVVFVITREDLCTIGFPRWQVAGLSDEEMCQIASQVSTCYTESFYSENLKAATYFVLCQRTRTNIIGEPI